MNSKLHTYLKAGPQCISIVGPAQSGKTTMLQDISMEWSSASRHELRAHVPDIFWMDALTELPKQSFLELYHKKIKSFCTTPSKKQRKMLVIDDVDLHSIPIQMQIYAMVQRHRHAVHICISYTCPNRVIPALVAQFVPISAQHSSTCFLSLSAKKETKKENENNDIMSWIQKSLLSLTGRKGTVKSRTAKMVEAWTQLHKNGLLLSDIFAFIGEGILHSTAFTDSQIFQFYLCYQKCPVETEHCIFLYLLADALATAAA